MPAQLSYKLARAYDAHILSSRLIAVSVMGPVRNDKVAEGAYINDLKNYTHCESVGVSLFNPIPKVL
jgi:hypothetical protein